MVRQPRRRRGQRRACASRAVQWSCAAHAHPCLELNRVARIDHRLQRWALREQEEQEEHRAVEAAAAAEVRPRVREVGEVVVVRLRAAVAAAAEEARST